MKEVAYLLRVSQTYHVMRKQAARKGTGISRYSEHLLALYKDQTSNGFIRKLESVRALRRIVRCDHKNSTGT